LEEGRVSNRERNSFTGRDNADSFLSERDHCPETSQEAVSVRLIGQYQMESRPKRDNSLFIPAPSARHWPVLGFSRHEVLVIGLLKYHMVYLLPPSLRETLLGQSGVGAIVLKSAYCPSETLNLKPIA
jgi:hypothetical protein